MDRPASGPARYVAAPEDLDSIVDRTREFLEERDAVGLFHLVKGVHDDEVIDDFAALFDGVVDLDEDGTVSGEF